ncbi:hypothetical protein PENTCL1PPCAC_7943, partial [Pristionchus entomophagus]
VKEVVPAGTSMHQADDGTVFYYKYQNPQRLYVKWLDAEMDVILLDGNEITEIQAKIVHSNSIYFLEGGKIYKADFSHDNGFVAAFIRDRLEGEVITFAGVCTRILNGRKSVYRLCDDPDKEGVLIAVTPENLEMMELRGIHRSKAIFLNSRSNKEPTAYHLSQNAIAINCLQGATPFIRDSSRLIYLTNQDCVFALDSDTALFQYPFLSCGQFPIRSIVAVHGDTLTVRGRRNDQECLMTAQLPSRYIDMPPKESIKLI